MVPRIDISALFSELRRARGDRRRDHRGGQQQRLHDHLRPAARGADRCGVAAARCCACSTCRPGRRASCGARNSIPPTAMSIAAGSRCRTAHETYKEGIDLGPDSLTARSVIDPHDPLREATPLPPETALPGWRAAAAAYFRAMERVGAGPDARAGARPRPAGAALRRGLRRRHLDPAADPLSGAAAGIDGRRSGGQAVGRRIAASATTCSAAPMSIPA